MQPEVNNTDWRKLLEITKLQCAAIPFIPERELAEKLCDELIAGEYWREVDATVSTSKSDRIFRKELRKELETIVALSPMERNARYGVHGWQIFVIRYLEATPD